jgi:two-component system OmpR family sensor kinase
VHAHGRHLLAVSQPVGRDRAILVTDLADDDSAVDIVLAVTVIGGLAALAAAAALSIPLLRAVLRPLRKVARTADAIAGGDLDRRADLARSPDEIGRFGAAFDRMVDQLQGALTQRDAVVENLRTQDQVMRRFLADASHELRTPLTAIRGGAQVLRLGAASDPRDLAEALGHIQIQTERMSRLIDDLLTLSRQDAGQPAAPRELIDLGALVAEHTPQWEKLAVDHTVSVHAEAAWVLADPEALTRACANLVDNAQKYSPLHTEITLAVSSADARVQLTVTDHGPGIPSADRDKVFRRFYRGDAARSRATGGAGLGLAIVAGIVADHDGHIRVDESPGGGAMIVLELPPATPTAGHPRRELPG